MEDLILPVEKILVRNKSECFDIILSGSHRKDIFEKLLSRRYELVVSDMSSFVQDEHCQVDFITTYNKNRNENQLALGEFSKIKKSSENSRVNSSQSMIVQKSYPASFRVGENHLDVKCEKLANDQFIVTIGHGNASGLVSTSVRVAKGVKFDIASSIKELNDKKSTLGIPQSEWLKIDGLENTTYELVVQ